MGSSQQINEKKINTISESKDEYGKNFTNSVKFDDYELLKKDSIDNNFKLEKIIFWTNTKNNIKYLAGYMSIYSSGSEMFTPGSHIGKIISSDMDFEEKEEFHLEKDQKITKIIIAFNSFIEGIKIFVNDQNEKFKEIGSYNESSKLQAIIFSKENPLFAMGGSMDSYLNTLKFYPRK